MPLFALVTHAHTKWTDEARDLLPGAHVAVLADVADVGIEGRLVGLELRDTMLVLRSGPSSGFVFIFRKPITEPTVAEQMMATGTGGINVNACRIPTADKLGGMNRHGTTPRAMQPGGGKRDVDPSGMVIEPEGRWPPNVVLVHGSECRNMGERTVERGGGIKRVNSGTKTGSVYGTYGELATPQYGGADGLENMTAWECEPGCPVALLDGQSGTSTSSSDPSRFAKTPKFKGTHYAGDAYSLEMSRAQAQAYGDSGGASRFYPQFTGEGDLRVWIERLVTPDARAS